ncbi:acylphosphatase [Candidatus Omnitrophota bacterium]
MKKRAHIYFDGRVQGVGFRFTAEYIAREMNVVGWAKNLPDGRVEVVAEGEQDSLNEFIDRIKTRMKRYISDEILDWEEYKGEFNSFGMRF